MPSQTVGIDQFHVFGGIGRQDAQPFAYRNVAWLSELTSEEISVLLVETLQRISTHYDNLFETSFPYAMGFHQAPFGGRPHREWILHAHFYPPLLLSATVRKFKEMLVMPLARYHT